MAYKYRWATAIHENGKRTLYKKFSNVEDFAKWRIGLFQKDKEYTVYICKLDKPKQFDSRVDVIQMDNVIAIETIEPEIKV